jgi:hypothetical protein
MGQFDKDVSLAIDDAGKDPGHQRADDRRP